MWTENQKKVVEKVYELIEFANENWDAVFVVPEIQFDLKSVRKNGTCTTRPYQPWDMIEHDQNERVKSCTIQYNPVLVEEHFDQFIETTVPHEVAHYITDALFGTRANGIRPHGKEWKFVMRELGATPATCNSYNRTDEAAVKLANNKVAAKCECGANTHVGKIIAGRIRKGTRYLCVKCDNRIELV